MYFGPWRAPSPSMFGSRRNVSRVVVVASVRYRMSEHASMLYAHARRAAGVVCWVLPHASIACQQQHHHPTSDQQIHRLRVRAPGGGRTCRKKCSYLQT